VVGIPEGTRSLAVIVDDPDAPLGTWTHWVEFDIPAVPGTYELEEGAENLGVPGVNSWNLEGYMGPCPPTGEGHTYFFEVYAVSTNLGLPAGVDVDEVVGALDGDVIDMVELTGTYSR
jgi:Raf kinase inhibitor-like YbhB/YbcL family protein